MEDANELLGVGHPLCIIEMFKLFSNIGAAGLVGVGAGSKATPFASRVSRESFGSPLAPYEISSSDIIRLNSSIFNSYRSTRSISLEDSVPRALSNMMEALIAQLDPMSKQLMLCCACVTRPFTAVTAELLLAAVQFRPSQRGEESSSGRGTIEDNKGNNGRNPADKTEVASVHDALQVLVDRQVLSLVAGRSQMQQGRNDSGAMATCVDSRSNLAQATAHTSSSTYTFVHSLLREAVHSMLTLDQERVLHTALANSVVDSPLRAQEAATHFIAAGKPGVAWPLYIRAASDHNGVGSYNDVRTLYILALETAIDAGASRFEQAKIHGGLASLMILRLFNPGEAMTHAFAAAELLDAPMPLHVTRLMLTREVIGWKAGWHTTSSEMRARGPEYLELVASVWYHAAVSVELFALNPLQYDLLEALERPWGSSAMGLVAPYMLIKAANLAKCVPGTNTHMLCLVRLGTVAGFGAKRLAAEALRLARKMMKKRLLVHGGLGCSICAKDPDRIGAVGVTPAVHMHCMQHDLMQGLAELYDGHVARFVPLIISAIVHADQNSVTFMQCITTFCYLHTVVHIEEDLLLSTAEAQDAGLDARQVLKEHALDQGGIFKSTRIKPAYHQSGSIELGFISSAVQAVENNLSRSVNLDTADDGDSSIVMVLAMKHMIAQYVAKSPEDIYPEHR